MTKEPQIVAGVDPVEFQNLSNFKGEVYDTAGAGTWLDDMKLEIVWRDAHGKDIPPHLEPLIKPEE